MLELTGNCVLDGRNTLTKSPELFLVPRFVRIAYQNSPTMRPNLSPPIMLFPLPVSRLRKVLVLQRLTTHNPPVRIVLQQARQHIRGGAAPQRLLRDEVRDRPLRPFREFRIVMRQPVHAVPVGVRIGRAPALEDFDELSMSDRPGKRGRPVAISAMMHPTLHTSTAAE